MELNIGQNIQRLRKIRNLTQEQLASAVGVSAAAVSKWETAGAYPDISLLPPLARLLRVSVDELLDYRDSLTEQEAEALIITAKELFEKGRCKEAQQYCEELLLEYPGDHYLELRTAALYMEYISAWLQADGVADNKEKFQEAEKAGEDQMSRAIDLFEKSLDSENEEIRETARYVLSGLYASKDRLDDALEMIDQLPKCSADPRLMKSTILFKKEMYEEARKLDQICLYEKERDMGLHLAGLSKTAAAQGNTKLAMYYNEAALKLNQLFGLDKMWGKDGNYYRVKAELCMKDNHKDEAFEALEEYIKSMSISMDMRQFHDNPFFDCIEWGDFDMSPEFLKDNIKIVLEQDDCFDGLKDDPRFQELLKLFS